MNYENMAWYYVASQYIKYLAIYEDVTYGFQLLYLRPHDNGVSKET